MKYENFKEAELLVEEVKWIEESQRKLEECKDNVTSVLFGRPALKAIEINSIEFDKQPQFENDLKEIFEKFRKDLHAKLERQKQDLLKELEKC